MKSKKSLYLFCCLALAVLIVSCDSSDGTSSTNSNPTEGADQVRTLFVDSVQAVFERDCVSCHAGKHATGGVFDYSDLDKALASAAAIETRVSAGTMPPPASTQAQQFTAEEKNLILRWTQLAQQ